ncbi:DUF1501 domain-containing protein [Alienimonas chondri]|uniref:DUF1501 domain-containing protein n=1 Tax=Alienimonas chondri TaxID=2681879 RepID=A0ABX1VAJ2_9PLAN|nr:DUF1501 domain-containing protein [Alienimonas chondri]NNJ24892.1 hypothetical protein [Alienimonas chondri]
MISAIRCDGVRRRDFVRVGGLSALGLSLADLARPAAAANQTGPEPRAKSCVLIWLDGGPSHLETFDPKPDAPVEVRGPLGSIATALPGVRFGECLEQTARLADRLAVVRSMTSPLGEHVFGTHYLMTGYRPTPALEYPTFGATLAHVRGSADNVGRTALPPHMAVGGFTGAVSGRGYLPTDTTPFVVGGEAAGKRPPGQFRVPDLDPYAGLDLPRLARRKRITAALDRFSRAGDADAAVGENPDLRRAYDLIASAAAKRAFDLTEEPAAIHNRYGVGNGNGPGAGCLLARRLVEREVPFVTVYSSGWDTHSNVAALASRYPGDGGAKLPALDRALAALLTDLDERQLLEETLVVVAGEFGRTPRINAAGGRDHWPNAFSMLMAGGGVSGGQVYGASDRLGEFPAEDAVTPADLAATIFTLLGVDPARELHTADGRPVRVAPDGARVLTDLLA